MTSENDSTKTDGTAPTTCPKDDSTAPFGLRPRRIGLLHLRKPPAGNPLRLRLIQDKFFISGVDRIDGVLYTRYEKRGVYQRTPTEKEERDALAAYPIVKPKKDEPEEEERTSAYS